MTHSDEPFTPISRTFSSQGLDLHYLDWGNRHLPTLILIHGMQDHAHSWDRVAAALRDHWHVVAPDLRGHGDSAWSPDGAYLPTYMLLDLAELVGALAVDQVVLVAHSFGGNGAARFAAIYPERVSRLVLVDAMGPSQAAIDHWHHLGPVKRTRDWLEKRRTARARQRVLASVTEAAERLRRGNPGLSAEMAQHLASHAVRPVAGGFVWKHDPLLGNFMPEDFSVHLSEFWREISAPTLLCWGAQSWNPNPATSGAADCFRQAHAITFEEAGHWLHHDQLDGFTAALKTFLNDTGAR